MEHRQAQPAGDDPGMVSDDYSRPRGTTPSVDHPVELSSTRVTDEFTVDNWAGAALNWRHRSGHARRPAIEIHGACDRGKAAGSAV